MIEFEHKDAFEYIFSLFNESIDLCLIDPPYCISRDTGMTSYNPENEYAKRFAMSYQFGDWDQTEINLTLLFSMIYPKMKKSSTIICFYDIWKITKLAEALEANKFKKLRFGEYLKTNPVPINSKAGYLSNCREIFVTATKGPGVFNSKYDNGLYSLGICSDAGRFHPTQKPLQLIMSLIEKHSNKDDNILDCFAGSGTTAVAASKLNRNFYGCELNIDFYEKASFRIKNEQNGFSFPPVFKNYS